MILRFLMAFSVTLFLAFAVFSFGAVSVHAQTVEDQYQDIQNQGVIFAGICTSADADCDCRDYGICTLEDVLQVVVNVSILVLGLSGTIMLLMFLWGGFTWLTANGNRTRIESGTKTMTGAVIGLVITFGAYSAVTFVVNVLKEGESPSSGETLEDVLGGDASDIIDTATQ